MNEAPPIAFVAHSDPSLLEIRINFGVFAGREATAAEIDELAQTLLPEVGEVSIVSEQRLEAGDGVEVLLHQVRVEVPGDRLPAPGDHLEEMRQRLVETAERWARSCIAERHAELTEL